MTKHQDSDARRIQVAEGLFAAVAQRGLESTTVRDVAEAAGVSVGLVQRYFRTKADLLLFGIQVVYERAEVRFHQVAIEPPVRRIVSQIAESLFPVDEERDQEFRVALAFWQASLHNPEMAETHRQATQRLIDGLAEAFTGAQRAGELPYSLDPTCEARMLIALVDGLALHATITADAFDAETITAALHAHLDRLFIPPKGTP